MTAERIRSGAPDPDDALRQLSRIEESAQQSAIALARSEEAISILALCCQRAPYLARLLARDPARLARVAGDPYLRRQKPPETVAAELAARSRGVSDAAELAAALRSYRGDELVRCGVRELALGKPIEVGAELAHLADACFDRAIAFHRAALITRYGEPLFVDRGVLRPCHLAVIAMGKHGGEELNFASDVDVIYVYSSDAEPEGARITLHEYFAELCRRVTAAMAEVTADDVVFRVDLRLRPEGSRGPIANSLPSLERYYETWGRPWERQAWLKARPCAGSAELGAEVMAMMRPFVYRRSVSVDVIAEVNALNRRIKAELTTSEVESGFDVKNGEGGIREIEFFVQALQLILAGRLPSLRVASTIGALDALLFAGVISESERQALGTAYRFLRHVEHLLQLESGRQTQRLPGDERALDLLARRLGFDGAAALAERLREHTSEVARLFATLGDPEPGPPPEVFAVLSGQRSADDERAALAALGFREPARAAMLLDRARRLAGSVFGLAPQGAAARVAAPLLAEISRSPDPDQALAHAVELAARRRSHASVWRLMDQNPEVLRLVASLFGTSQYLSRQLLADPELLDLLLLAGQIAPRRAVAEIERELADTLAIDPDDEESSWNALAEIKNEQVFRVGLADVGGELGPLEVCAELSAIAEAVVHHACETVERSLRARHGWPRDESGAPVPFAVMALGKLGGRELGYASDLDIVFVYGGDGESDGRRPLPAVSFFSRFAQRLMGGLRALHPTGRLYDVDTRLRPSGSQGMLVSSLAAWRKYHATRARLWERQALTKLRFLAGARSLGEIVEAEVADFLYGAGRAQLSPAEIAAEVRSMRERIERELAGAKAADLKVGRGGLVDIEFAAQYLQLAFGHEHPELRVRSTVKALEAARDLDLGLELADRDALSLLAEGYSYLRSLEHRVRIVNDQPVHALPAEGPELEKLARRAGYARVEQLHESFAYWTASIRDAFQAVVS